MFVKFIKSLNRILDVMTSTLEAARLARTGSIKQARELLSQ